MSRKILRDLILKFMHWTSYDSSFKILPSSMICISTSKRWWYCQSKDSHQNHGKSETHLLCATLRLLKECFHLIKFRIRIYQVSQGLFITSTIRVECCLILSCQNLKRLQVKKWEKQKNLSFIQYCFWFQDWLLVSTWSMTHKMKRLRIIF